MDAFPTLTPEEAAARLPSLRPVLSALREAFHEYRFALSQREELREMTKHAVLEPWHADHEEWRGWADRTATLYARVQALVTEANALGADVKDPILGLVDFYARRADGSLALLCFRDDEEGIAYWHDADTGFSGRRPLSEL